MNSHDVGRGRGGLSAALAGYAGSLHVAGVSYRPALPAAAVRGDRRPPTTGSVLSVIDSAHGHDGFLIETEQVGVVIARALGEG